MTTILLIRHAENEYVKKGRLAGRLPGVHLNENGRVQANALAETLRGLPVQAVYSSPLERTMETAAPIATTLGLTVQPHDGLLEVDFGEWQDQTLKTLRRHKLWRTVQHNPTRMRFPGGETFANAQQRIVTTLEELAKRHPDPKALLICVSHSDLIKLAVAYYLGLPLDLFQRLQIAPTSLTALHLDAQGGAGLLTINYLPDWPQALKAMLESHKKDKHSPPKNR